MELCDLTYIKHLSNGDNEFLISLIDIFVKHTPDALEEIKLSYAKKDYETIRRVAHRIKLSIYSLKINTISNEIKALSLLDKEKLTDYDIKCAITKIDITISKVIQELKELHP
ncbi:MAG: hypothetical protein PHT69_02865 [Bacteroidales bacterium]|nr:hypothetical protein [Bacteroidales bacterium]